MRRAGSLLAGLLLIVASGCESSPPARPAREPSALITASRVDRGPVEKVLETYGSVQFDPERTRDVTVTRSGEVCKLFVTPGQGVSKGEALLALGPFPEDSPEAQRARINLRFAQRDLSRRKHLASLHLATKRDLQEAERQLAIDRATLRSLGLGGNQDELNVVSPVDGIVAAVKVKRGSLIHAGAAVVVVAAAAMAVRTGFEIEDLPRLAAGLAVEVSPIVGAGARPVQARLTPLHRVGDPRTQLVRTIIPIADPPGWMVPGIRVRVRVILEREPEALRVPRDALTKRKHEPGVFAVIDGHARWTPIQAKVRGERFLGISGDLAPGDLVVTIGKSSLADGLAVRLSTSGSAG